MKKERVFALGIMTLAALFLWQPAIAASDEVYRIISPEELKTLFDSKADTFVIIDARNPEEYQEVHIPGAINVPQKKFAEFRHLLPKDLGKELIFYCNGVKCGKSKKSAKLAAEEGYKNISVFAQGMPVWEELNYPITTGPDYEKKIETAKLSQAELKKLIDSGSDDFTIVDVRDKSEFAEGHIPGALNIPVANFASRSGELDKKKKIIVYCNAGSRSYLAYRKLMKLAYKKIYQSLYADWQAAALPIAK